MEYHADSIVIMIKITLTRHKENMVLLMETARICVYTKCTGCYVATFIGINNIYFGDS